MLGMGWIVPGCREAVQSQYLLSHSFPAFCNPAQIALISMSPIAHPYFGSVYSDLNKAGSNGPTVTS